MLSSTVMSIGPSDAKELVKNRDHQRKLSRRTVSKYTKEMKAGRWKLSGASISIWVDTEGEWGDKGEIYVLNGQHRLQAVIESGTTQDFLVVYEDNSDVFNTFDDALTRTIGTMVGLAIGPENSQAISVMAGMVLHYERHPKETWLTNLVSKSEITEWVEQQAEAGHRARMDQCVRDYGALRAQLKSLGHWYTTLSWLARTTSAHSDRWLEFHEGVVHGAGLASDDPRLILRNYHVRSQRDKGDRWQRQVELALGIKCWNSFVTDTPRKGLMFRRDEVESTGMPQIQ